MLVSFRSRLVILAMPKCASTSLEKALEGTMDIVLRGNPTIKHMRLQHYQRFVLPYLQHLTDEPFEVVSAFREPEDWLHSWWRYRRRDGMQKHQNSTKGLSFEAFVELYLDGGQKPADVGRQSRFVSAERNTIGVDRIFRYDHMDRMVAYLTERLGTEIPLEHHNVSPRAPWIGSKLSARQRDALRASIARDYEIYETIAE